MKAEQSAIYMMGGITLSLFGYITQSDMEVALDLSCLRLSALTECSSHLRRQN